MSCNLETHNNRGRNWSDEAINHRMPRTVGHCQKQERGKEKFHTVSGRTVHLTPRFGLSVFTCISLAFSSPMYGMLLSSFANFI